MKILLSCLIIPIIFILQSVSISKAETLGPTSRLKQISDVLTESGYRDVGPGPWGDWGPMWNRIYSASNWAPYATATVSDVASGKTFYTGGNRVRQQGQGITQPAPIYVNVPSDPSKISLIYQSVKSKSYGLETGGYWGNWGAVWNRLYSSSVWTPSDANAIPEDVNLGITFYAGNNRILQTGTYQYHEPSGNDTTGPIVSIGAHPHSYVNLVRVFIGSASDTDSGVASNQWTKQIGPGTVTFGNPTSLITTAKANVRGIYILRLTSADNSGNINYSETEYVVHKMADYNNDNYVDGLDFSYLAQNWGGTDIMADFNGDGTVDGLDFSLLAINWSI